ncbi:hypothetical protein POM88_027053 [Heracleum sosnowskyi]|uniref:CTP synthase (glutamine hydrolyzing) n=1 Tax=Heracleum sosnowskyi TaxID=360622 RepID=A0AAD8I891_9APIA|nr:hypothetical protein POM88_027053 [Heracleum sosnowskyi]
MLSSSCYFQVDNIITLYDEQRAHEAILKVLNLSGVAKKSSLEEWTSRANLCDRLHVPVRVAMVGKYTGLSDSYLSVLKALLHASVACRRKLTKESPKDYRAAWNLLKGADAILVPGGFGDRGMQIAVVEFARSVLGLEDANSAEFDPKTRNPCVIFMPEGSKTHMGGTMRLGSRRTYFQVKDCKSAKLYGNRSFIDERHRHRYEVNPDMVPQLERAGFLFTGKDETGQRMEDMKFIAKWAAKTRKSYKREELDDVRFETLGHIQGFVY